MPNYRFQVSAAADGLLARDRIVNTLCFNYDTPVGNDVTGDAGAVIDAFQARIYGPGREITCKVYELPGDASNPPLATVTQETGGAPSSSIPREIALCLSFRAEEVSPRKRGRIYLPAFALTGAPGNRPNSTVQTKLLDLASDLSGIGGTDVDWSIWSHTNQESYQVKHVWVDDEWDTMRSRGLRATGRLTRDVSG